MSYFFSLFFLAFTLSAAYSQADSEEQSHSSSATIIEQHPIFLKAEENVFPNSYDLTKPEANTNLNEKQPPSDERGFGFAINATLDKRSYLSPLALIFHH